MKLDSYFLCDFAQQRSNLLTAVSAGITRVVVGIPASLYVAGFFRVEDGEQEIVHEFAITLLDQEAKVIAKAVMAMQVASAPDRRPGEPLLIPFAFRLPEFVAQRDARYDVRIGLDDTSADLWFYGVAAPIQSR